MSKHNSHKLFDFLTGRGFYAALALCLIGTGAAAWVAVDRTLGDIAEENDRILRDSSSLSPSPADWENPAADAGAGKEGLTISSPSSSSAPRPSSSSSQSAAPQGPSAPSAPPKTPSTSVYALPVKGELLCGFSNGKLIKDPTLKEWRTHNGVDWKADRGTPVRAIADGMVTAVTEDPMWGWTVEVTHGGQVVSLCCGLARDIPVKKGESVKLGQVLGAVDQCPAEIAQPPHLHLEVRQKGVWIDPMSLLEQKK